MKQTTQQVKFIDPETSSLSEVIDRLLHHGVVIAGDLVLSVADVDLVYCELRLLLISMNRYEELKQLPKAE
ncbi:MAG: gas vesicle protein [Flammeovirgaceae bacterium]